MLRVTSSDPSEEFIEFVRSWFNLLANGQFEEACAALDKSNTYGITWTPEMIHEVLIDNFGPGTGYDQDHPEGVSVSQTASTRGEPRADVLAFDDGSGYSVEHDVPLNGEWSELTAQFEFMKHSQGYAVILHDLHVL